MSKRNSFNVKLTYLKGMQKTHRENTNQRKVGVGILSDKVDSGQGILLYIKSVIT